MKHSKNVDQKAVGFKAILESNTESERCSWQSAVEARIARVKFFCRDDHNSSKGGFSNDQHETRL